VLLTLPAKPEASAEIGWIIALQEKPSCAIWKFGGAVTRISMSLPRTLLNGMNVKVTGFLRYSAPVTAVLAPTLTVWMAVLVRVHSS